jgi:hypothetical protein
VTFCVSIGRHGPYLWPSRWPMGNRLPSSCWYVFLNFCLQKVYVIYSTTHVTFIYLIIDTVNGFSFHPYLPLATTSSGHRRFGMEDESEEESSLSGVCECVIHLYPDRCYAFRICLCWLIDRFYTILFYLFCTLRWWELLLCLEVFLLSRNLKAHQALSSQDVKWRFWATFVKMVHWDLASWWS